MKYGLFVIFLAIATCANATLNDDVKDLGALVPKSKLVAIVGKHLIFDKEFRNFKNFIGTQEFAQAWETILRNQEFRTVVDYVQESGADLIGSINKLAHALKVSEYPKDVKIFDITPRTLMSFVDEVLNAMPKGDMSKMMKEKMTTSPEFKKLHDRLSDVTFEKIVLTARNCQGLAPVEALLRSKGLNIDKVLDIGKDVLSWAN